MSENGADVSWHDVGKVLEEEISSAEDIQADLVRNNKGNICQSIDNCMTVFQRDLLLKGAIRKNELSGKIDIVGDLGWERTSSSLTDTDVYQLHWYLEKQYGLKNERNINKAMNIAASENRYHPIREYLEQLVWDGKHRIGRLLPKYLGAEEDAYTREIMQLLMLAAIHRVYEPGCKYEIMVCLVGGQGAGKSTFFRFLAIKDEWFSDDLKLLGKFVDGDRRIPILIHSKVEQNPQAVVGITSELHGVLRRLKKMPTAYIIKEKHKQRTKKRRE